MELKRIARKDTYTIGKLYIDGVYFCDTLEPTDRGLVGSMSESQIKAIKVKGKTAIPTGTYNMALTHSPRFKRILPLLLGVKGFDGVRVHAGNTAKDTEGCILVGKNDVVGKVTNSRNTLSKLLARWDYKKGVIIKIS